MCFAHSRAGRGADAGDEALFQWETALCADHSEGVKSIQSFHQMGATSLTLNRALSSYNDCLSMKFMSASYRKEMQKQLRIAAKATGWKQSKGVVFRKCDEWFIAGHWRNVSASSADGICIEIMAKPMAIDPMLWSAMGLESNKKQPLSFRYWGAFICGIPVVDSEVIQESDPERTMQTMIKTLNKLLPVVLRRLSTTKFSEIAMNPAGIHDNWRMGETIIHALRLEGELDRALEYASNHEGTFSISESIIDPKRSGKSHNEFVVSSIKTEQQTRTLGSLFHRFFHR